MEGFLIFVVFVLLVMGWVWLRDKMWAGATRAVFSGSHQKGQTATHSTAHFSAPVENTEFMRALLSYLNLPTAAPAVIGGLHVNNVDYDGGVIVFAVGNKLSDSMRLGVVVWPEEEGWSVGCKGEASVLDWQEVNGLVSNTDDIERIFRAIDATAAHFQGRVQYTRDPA